MSSFDPILGRLSVRDCRVWNDRWSVCCCDENVSPDSALHWTAVLYWAAQLHRPPASAAFVSRAWASLQYRRIYRLELTVVWYQNCKHLQLACTIHVYIFTYHITTMIIIGDSFVVYTTCDTVSFYCLSNAMSNAMHGQNINLPVCVCLCVCHTFCQLFYRSDPSTDFYSW